MTFRAFGYNLREEDYGLIKKMISVATKEPVEVVDLRSFDMQVSMDDVVFLFGLRPKKEFAGQKVKRVLELPDPIRLDAAFGEKELRKEAHEKLAALGEAITKGKVDEQEYKVSPRQTITPSRLPDLSSSEVLALEASLAEQGITEWKGTTESGRTVRLTATPSDSPADINMTFAELYGLRLAMEVLQVREIEIVFKPSIDPQEGDRK